MLRDKATAAPWLPHLQGGKRLPASVGDPAGGSPPLRGQNVWLSFCGCSTVGGRQRGRPGRGEGGSSQSPGQLLGRGAAQGSIWGRPPRRPALPQDAVPAPSLRAVAGPVQRAFWAARGHLSQGDPHCGCGRPGLAPPGEGVALSAHGTGQLPPTTSGHLASGSPDQLASGRPRRGPAHARARPGARPGLCQSHHPAWGRPLGVGEPLGGSLRAHTLLPPTRTLNERGPHGPAGAAVPPATGQGPCAGTRGLRKEVPACVCCQGWRPVAREGVHLASRELPDPLAGGRRPREAVPGPGMDGHPSPGLALGLRGQGQVLAYQAHGRARGCHG